MSNNSKAKQLAKKVMELFASGNISKPLSVIFLNLDSEVPMFSWSFRNQLLCVANGMTDARGFKQWRKVDRFVMRGERSYTSIFIPLFKKKDPDDPDSELVLSGFTSAAVFDVSQTDGAPLLVSETQQFLSQLPLIEVAKHWSLDVLPLLGRPEYAGTYDGNEIRLGVANLSTWFHELVHAADDRGGYIKEYRNTWANETVAELGQCVLSRMVQAEVLDDGKAWRYISGYAHDNDLEPIDACSQVFDRVVAAVSLIMDTAKELGITQDFFHDVQPEQQLVEAAGGD